MPPLQGFTDNNFVTRSDLVRAARALVQPLEKYRSPLGARVKIRPATVAGFDDVAAQLEGFCRPLLAIGALLEDDGLELLQQWCKGLENGVDPQGEEYWGDVGDKDQRMVEMESISIALLSAPDKVLPMISEVGQKNLGKWLSQINDHEVPQNNWRWFRIFVNLVLTQLLGVPKSEVEARMKGDFDLLDSHYQENGWSSDGPWNDARKQADYYSGSFAIQFCQLLFVRFAQGHEVRKEKYKEQARMFGAEYWRYFDIHGAAIPFGRSMTYRFAFAGFWAAVAVAGVELPAPVNNLGTVKGLLLRHLRWWRQHEDMFNADGVVNIGFAYPNMYLCENYNSPQSVYWCLKSFVALLVKQDGPFWQCEELPHPLSTDESSVDLCKALWQPKHIIDSSRAHHFMLSSGQMTTMPHKAKDAKYCKFAYSSAFGFSVSTGMTLGQMAPDSTLSVSLDHGETWRVRSAPTDVQLESVAVGEGQRVQGITSTWKPWRDLDLVIETTLVPLAQHAPGWHLRLHKLRWSKCTEEATDQLQLVDGGFAIPAMTARGLNVPEVSSWDNLMGQESEGRYSDKVSSAMVRSSAGAGGISHLGKGGHSSEDVKSEAFVLDADPNTNLISPRTFIPCVKHMVKVVPGGGSAGRTDVKNIELTTGVFAVVSDRVAATEIRDLWEKKPSVVRLEDKVDASVRYKVETSG